MHCVVTTFPPSWPDDEEQRTEVTNKIWNLYNAGVPFFTKKSLEEVARQLKDYNQRTENRTEQKIMTRGVDGKQIVFTIETGRTGFGESGVDEELVLTSPFIYYVPFEDLISDTYNSYFDLAYCNLRIYHYTERRRESSKEVIEPQITATVEETENLFRKIQESWEGSETYRQFRSTLLSLSTPLSKIRKVVVFALYSLSLKDPNEELEESLLNRRSAYQHSLLLTLRTILLQAGSQNHPSSLTCYAQEPLYTTSDKIVLSKHSITTVDDPQGFLEVDESTAVISIAAHVPVKEIIADIARPAIMICNRVPREGDEDFGRRFTDGNPPRVNDMIRHCYDEYQFPKGSEDQFGDLAIYVRRRERIDESLVPIEA